MLKVFEQVCQNGFATAHSQGVIHRT